MSDELDQRIWVRVTGRVQGVGFRYFTQEVANNLQLSGWVRNDSDGSVECEAQGSTEKLEQFIYNMQQGPCLSRVEKVESHRRPTVQKDSGFHCRS
jgi:acylphosphatase